MLDKYSTTEPSCVRKRCMLQTYACNGTHVETRRYFSGVSSSFYLRCFAFGGLKSGDWAFTSAFPALAGPQKYIINVKNSDFRHFF